MDREWTNGAADEAVAEAGLERRAAGLSADVVRDGPPDGLALTPLVSAAQLVARLEVIREAMRTAMQEGVDYGRVPGTDKPGLWKPGAEKLAVLFQLDIQPRNELQWGPGEHLTVISRATVYHAPSGTRLGYGEGICTTREKKHATRRAGLTCPACGQANIRRSKNPGEGYYCWRKTGGCGATFAEGDQQITAQTAGEVENPDLPDTWNTIDKMAKKRAYVDAALSVTGASAIFTQDIGSDPTEPSGEPGLPYGPVLGADAKSPASSAAIRLCGGDIEQARTLWAELHAALDGYMPQAAAIALIHAAAHVARGEKAVHPGEVDATRAASTQQRDGTTAARSGRATGTDTARPPGPPAGGDGEGPSAHRAAVSAGETRVSEPAALVRELAHLRGVDHAELANLIRVAAGGQRIPSERATAQLEALLERITEPIAVKTLEMIDTLHPAVAEDGGTAA